MLKEQITANVVKYTINATGLSDEIYIGNNSVINMHIICDSDAVYTIKGRMYRNEDNSIATDLGQIDSNNFFECSFSGFISNDLFTIIKSVAFDITNLGTSGSFVVFVGTK